MSEKLIRIWACGWMGLDPNTDPPKLLAEIWAENFNLAVLKYSRIDQMAKKYIRFDAQTGDYYYYKWKLMETMPDDSLKNDRVPRALLHIGSNTSSAESQCLKIDGIKNQTIGTIKQPLEIRIDYNTLNGLVSAAYILLYNKDYNNLDKTKILKCYLKAMASMSGNNK